MASYQNKSGNGLKHRSNEFIEGREHNFYFAVGVSVGFITTGKKMLSSTFVGLLIELTSTDVYVANEIYEIMEPITSGCGVNDENQI